MANLRAPSVAAALSQLHFPPYKEHSMFDAAKFIQATFTEANSTRLKPAPAGEYMGQIQEIRPESFTSGVSGEKSKNPGMPWTRLDLGVKVDGDPRIQAACGLPSKTVRASLMLDLTPEGNIDMAEGKNIGLGRLREAVGLNTPGKPFSFNQLAGQMVKINVVHRPNEQDPTIVYEDVKGFLRP